MKAHIVDKGYSWEYTVAEEDRRMWKIDGFMPPPYQSEAMNMWMKVDKAVPYE